jgi:putative ABC transport system permease protein
MNRALARLAPGVTHAQAQAQIESLLGSAAREAPANRRGPRKVRVVDLRESLVGNVRMLLLVLLGVVAFVLLIGCANMANLLLARAGARAQEMHVRASLGASRARLLRQLLTESAALSALGGGLGLLLVNAGLPALLRFVPAEMLPRIDEVRVNAGVLGFTLLASLATGLLFGSAPALLLLRGPAGAGGQRPGASALRRERRLHGALIVAETALVLVLLVGAGLLLRSFSLLQQVDPGFRKQGLLTMSVWLPERGYASAQAKRDFHQRLLERLRSEPELREVSAINLLPFGPAGWQGDFEVEGRDGPSDLIVGKPAVSDGYFRTLGIPLLRGRAFDHRDVDGAPRVAIVSESVARHCWPGQDALGKRLIMDDPQRQSWREVVGVVGDVRQGSLAGKPQPAIYVPLSQETRGFFLAPMAYVARPRADASRAANALRAHLRAADPGLPPQGIEFLERLLEGSLAEPRLRTALLAGFGALALLLALVGIHGVMSFEVSRRTPEIGIRRALGAATRDVLALVLGRTLRLVGAGLLLGLLGAAAATRSLQAFLFEVTPTDAATFGCVSAGLMSAALQASLLPARRAAGVDPATALRCE